MSRWFILIILCAGCYRVSDQIEPQLQPLVQDRYLKALPTPFAPLSPEERATDWGKEEVIAVHFARDLDLFRAVTTFKRALYLMPPDAEPRKREVLYEILLCYYVGGKYDDALATFDENSSLNRVGRDFPAFDDLVAVLYDSSLKAKDSDRAKRLLEWITAAQEQPDLGTKLSLYTSFSQGKIDEIASYADGHPEADELKDLLSSYAVEKKSVGTAQLLNALLPGSGYLYLGQKTSATTAFFLNGLFIAASTTFFLRGNVAAGAIFTTLESGWYFGGIYGAGQEAKLYNERVFEKLSTPYMQSQRLFPLLMLHSSF